MARIVTESRPVCRAGPVCAPRGAPLEDAQSRASPSTACLYESRDKTSTRNIVKRISV